ncbi:MAG: DUF192 domain-containing protein [Thermomicrobiales bacterium]
MNARSHGRRPRSGIALLVIALLLGTMSATVAQTTQPPPWHQTPTAPLEQVDIVVGDTTLVVEVAEEDWAQQLGLGYRNGLAPGTGMLFPSGEARARTFWMKGMRFCLDIVWINNGVITGAAEGLCPDPAGIADADRPSVTSPGPVDYVLEVPAGWLQEHGYGVGTPVLVPSLTSEAPLVPGTPVATP